MYLLNTKILEYLWIVHVATQWICNDDITILYSVRYSSTNKEQQNVADSSTTGKAKTTKSRWKRWFSRDEMISRLLSSARNAILKSVGYLVKINFVLTLFSMMVSI